MRYGDGQGTGGLSCAVVQAAPRPVFHRSPSGGPYLHVPVVAASPVAVAGSDARGKASHRCLVWLVARRTHGRARRASVVGCTDQTKALESGVVGLGCTLHCIARCTAVSSSH
jgi:hypothetical protein